MPGIVVDTDASERESLHDGMHSLFSVTAVLTDQQPCTLSGAKLGHASFTAKRKKNCCKKNNDVSWHSLIGRLIGGQNRAPATPLLTMLSRRVSAHMQHGRPFFDGS